MTTKCEFQTQNGCADGGCIPHRNNECCMGCATVRCAHRCEQSKSRVLYADSTVFLKANGYAQVPTREEIEQHYTEVCRLDGTPDEIFAELNEYPTKYIRQLPPGVNHTSMSVGDIISTGESLILCKSVGWEAL